jgi:hypothetical protein
VSEHERQCESEMRCCNVECKDDQGGSTESDNNEGGGEEDGRSQ